MPRDLAALFFERVQIGTPVTVRAFRFLAYHSVEGKEVFTSHVLEMDRLSRGFPVFG